MENMVETTHKEICWSSVGKLILRVGVGALFIYYGYPKMMAGPEMRAKLGGAMGIFGIIYYPVFWGFMAAFAEFVGGILLVFGLLTRFAACLMFITMVVATAMHLQSATFFEVAKYDKPLIFAIVFLAIIFIGAGRYSLDKLFNRKI